MAVQGKGAAGQWDAADRRPFGRPHSRRSGHAGPNLAFQQELERLGWSVGRNVRIDYRWGLGNAGNIRNYAEELAALAPDVILTSGNSTMSSMLQAKRTVPIVFVNVADPVGSGFVDSLARPGGNATGFVQFEYNLSGKWPELLKEIAPSVTRAAVIRDRALVLGYGQFD